MKLSYEDMISGAPIFIPKIGHVRSPQVKELRPDGIGLGRYHLYLNVLCWNKSTFADFLMTGYGGGAAPWADRIVESPELNIFDVVTITEETMGLLQEAIAFFITEKVFWDKNESCFITTDETDKQIGKIDRTNYEEVRNVILELNYISKDATNEQKYDNRQAKEAWAKVLEAQRKDPKNRRKPKKESKMSLGNVISKLCVVSNSYNLLNIYELTVYQLYDQFSQYCFLRSAEFGERVYSIHGGKKFKFEQWLDPIFEK